MLDKWAQEQITKQYRFVNWCRLCVVCVATFVLYLLSWLDFTPTLIFVICPGVCLSENSDPEGQFIGL